MKRDNDIKTIKIAAKKANKLQYKIRQLDYFLRDVCDGTEEELKKIHEAEQALFSAWCGLQRKLAQRPEGE